MAAGITLANWAKGEACRVYALLGESDDDGNRRRLIEWIERRIGDGAGGTSGLLVAAGTGRR